jgi:nitrous oxidase accessory protein NosD
VTENDFVENDLQVTTAEGAMRIWGQDGVGNYWSNAPPGAEEFRPTDPIDSSTTTVDGLVTVHESPAYSLLHRLETVVPGMLSTGIVDESPLSEPAVYDAEAHEGQTVLASAAERRGNDGTSNNE